MSNKLLTDYSARDFLVQTLKTVAASSSNWKGIITAGGGPTSRSLIDQLFEHAITHLDETLAKMMLQIGADPNQHILDEHAPNFLYGAPAVRYRAPAVDFVLRRKSDEHLDGIINILLDSGAVCGQMSLKHAILYENVNIAERMLESDPSLDVNFNYLDSLDPPETSRLEYLNLETATLLGLVCLRFRCWACLCDKATLSATINHPSGCVRSNTAISYLKYLFRRGAVITLDTMILASFSADVFILRFLIQQGGIVHGFNHFGFSCLDAAS